MLKIHWSKKGWVIAVKDDPSVIELRVPETITIHPQCQLVWYGNSGFVEVDGVLKGTEIHPA